MTRLEIVMQLLKHVTDVEMPDWSDVDAAFAHTAYILKKEREALAADVERVRAEDKVSAKEREARW